MDSKPKGTDDALGPHVVRLAHVASEMDSKPKGTDDLRNSSSMLRLVLSSEMDSKPKCLVGVWALRV